MVRFKRLSQAFEVLKQNKKQKDEAAELVTGSLVATQHRLDWDETIHGGSNSHVAAGSSLTPEKDIELKDYRILLFMALHKII